MSRKHLEKAVRTQEGMYRRHVRQIKQGTGAELRKAPFLLATSQRYCSEALCHTCAFECCCCCCSSWFSLHMSKINSFFKRSLGPSTANTSASGDEDLEPPKNKSLKSESNRDNTAYLKTAENWGPITTGWFVSPVHRCGRQDNDNGDQIIFNTFFY